MTTKSSSSDDAEVLIWEATEAATFELDGETFSVVPGQPGTTFRAGHPAVAARPELFKPFEPNYDWAPRNQSSASQRGARTR